MNKKHDNSKDASEEKPALDCLDHDGSAIGLGDTVVPGPLLPEAVIERPSLPESELSMADLAAACRIFLKLAYPAGRESMPPDRCVYADISADDTIADYLPGSPRVEGLCNDLRKKGQIGYEFRLGSAGHPHIKLKVQRVELKGKNLWVFSVDTHDHFHRAARLLQGDEAAQWHEFMKKNSDLKGEIEKAFAAAGLLTPIDLLRIDVRPSAN